MTNYDNYWYEVNPYTTEDGYKEKLNKYLKEHKTVTIKDLLENCKNRDTNPFSASMARWLIRTYSNIAEQCDSAKKSIKDIVEQSRNNPVIIVQSKL